MKVAKSEPKLKEETVVWLEQAEEHWKDANWLLEGRRYSACLYSCHQALEKILKGAVVQLADEIPPKEHQLESIARKAKLDLPKGWDEDLAEITRHFWRVRYPDFRRSVYTSKTKIMPTYEKTKEIYLWLVKILSKNS